MVICMISISFAGCRIVGSALPGTCLPGRLDLICTIAPDPARHFMGQALSSTRVPGIVFVGDLDDSDDQIDDDLCNVCPQRTKQKYEAQGGGRLRVVSGCSISAAENTKSVHCVYCPYNMCRVYSSTSLLRAFLRI